MTAVRGEPEAPAGYDSHDAATFYGVLPSTQAIFDVTLENDFVPPNGTPQTFRLTILAVGRAGTELDRRDVYVTVPAT